VYEVVEDLCAAGLLATGAIDAALVFSEDVIFVLAPQGHGVSPRSHHTVANPHKLVILNDCATNVARQEKCVAVEACEKALVDRDVLDALNEDSAHPLERPIAS
jgi:hypothetical protein